MIEFMEEYVNNILGNCPSGKGVGRDNGFLILAKLMQGRSSLAISVV